MSKQDKLLDIMAMAQLPLDVKIARLAHKWIGKSFPREQAKAVAKCYLSEDGRISDLTDRLMEEKKRQERIHNERKAVLDSLPQQDESPMLKYRSPNARRKRIMEIAQRTFGQHVRENFNEDTLSLMSLLDGESRWYQVNWLDAGFKPVRSALIEVVTVSPSKGTMYSRFLLYKTNGRVLVARTSGHTVLDAWGTQLPEAFVATAPILKEQGYSFHSDLEGQEMVVYGPDGEEVKRVPWAGRTVDD